jgi:hypothetical protein
LQKALANSRPVIVRRSSCSQCSAKTRAGGRRLARVEPGKRRCRFHGGCRQARKQRPAAPVYRSRLLWTIIRGEGPLVGSRSRRHRFSICGR